LETNTTHGVGTPSITEEDLTAGKPMPSSKKKTFSVGSIETGLKS